jgi:hypothetical protein
MLPNLDYLEGARLVSHDGTFLGLVTRDRFDANSLSNQFGTYGSRYSATSIFNQYGQYGSLYSPNSPFNQFASNPPRLMKDGKLLAHLTVNRYISPRVEPQQLIAWLGQPASSA